VFPPRMISEQTYAQKGTYELAYALNLPNRWYEKLTSKAVYHAECRLSRKTFF
jgi:hypothetical protein